jgi:hypothetical protein
METRRINITADHARSLKTTILSTIFAVLDGIL